MSRTRRLAIDDDQTWLLRATYLASGNEGFDGVVDHGADDYIYISTDGSGDDGASFSVLLYTSATTAESSFTVWGIGIISLGAPTTEQIAFVTDASATTDLSQFPGQYITVGYFDPNQTDITINIRNASRTGFANAYTEVMFNATAIRIYNDRLEIDGGAGIIDLGTGVHGVFDSTSGPYRLANLLTRDGTAGDDIIDLSGAPQTIHGLGGNDTITANKGGSDLYGDDGNDTLTGGPGGDHLFGGIGNDILKGGPGDLLDGGAGNDTLYGASRGTFIGGDGTDRLVIDFTAESDGRALALADGKDGTITSLGITYSGIEQIEILGGAGNDALQGSSEANAINGGAGADQIDGGAGDDILDAGIGDAVPEPPIVGYGSFFGDARAVEGAFTARQGADPLAVLQFDVISFFFSDAYYKVVVGAGGHLVVENSSTQPVFDGFNVELIDANQTVVASNVTDEALNVSDLAAGTYVIRIFTSNTPVSSSTSQVLVSLSTATGIERHNVLTGGLGDDTFLVHQTTDEIIEKSGEGTDTVIADLAWTLGANLENLTLKAGAGALAGTGNELQNRITGNDSANMLKGGNGNDTLIGGGGNDNLRGDGGADRMEGGTGNDAYRVENALDTVIEQVGEGIDKVVSSVTWTLPANVEILKLAGTDPLNGTGNALANTLAGNGGDNVLDGRAGADAMLGGAGDDTYMVDDLRDRVYETSTVGGTLDAGGVDKVLSSVTYSIAAGGRVFIENLSLVGKSAINATGNELANRLVGNNAVNTLVGLGGADTISGNGGDDKLYGGAGNDMLLGGAGIDRLDPGTGKDILTGGTSADLFIFTSEALQDAGTAAAVDRITDFSHAERDRIDLRQIDANSLIAGDQAFTFLGTGAFTGHEGELRVLSSATATFLVADLDGNGVGDAFVRLGAGIALVAADLLL